MAMPGFTRRNSVGGLRRHAERIGAGAGSRRSRKKWFFILVQQQGHVMEELKCLARVEKDLMYLLLPPVA